MYYMTRFENESRSVFKRSCNPYCSELKVKVNAVVVEVLTITYVRAYLPKYLG